MTVADNDAPLATGLPIDEREARLATGADDLADRRVTIVRHPSFLLAVAGTLLTTGIAAIVVAWIGASRSTLIEEQVPYLISGGLLGVALAIVGALTFFSHWLTVLIREARAHEVTRARDHAEMLEAVRDLRGALTGEGGGNGATRGARRRRSVQ
jgi:hypothetical protein